MNRNLSNFYSKLIDVGYATEKDIYDALYAGIRNEDISLVAKCLSMLPPQDEWNNEDYPYSTGKDSEPRAADSWNRNGIQSLFRLHRVWRDRP